MIYFSPPLRINYPLPAQAVGRCPVGGCPTGRCRQQRGSTLLVALVMLVLLTLIAVSSINSTSSNIELVANAQFREEALAATQVAVENVLSNNDFKTTQPGPQQIDINKDGIVDYSITFNPAPQCISRVAAVATDVGFPSQCAADAKIGSICYWTVWDIRAVVADVSTGASLTLHQGVRTLVGWDTAVAACP